ncbi:MAG: metallophosphoesterase [Firmicutes bacterium]|nr:metallophosphoesterase [Bacillota bacterium]
MKILAIGDTHGKLNKVRDIFPKLRDIDLIIHTGDHYKDAERLSEEFGIPSVAVKGNCDGCHEEDFQIVETEFGNILLTHGHMENVKYHLNTLMYKAQENNCIAVVFGHTHHALIEEAGGIRFINPGSLTLPRDGSDGSYAIIRTTEDSFDASVVYYSTIMGNKKKPQAGFIRGLLNYSDRF